MSPLWASADRCRGGFRLLLFRAEPLHQDAAALFVGQQAGALVGPHLVRDLEFLTPRASIGSAQGGIVLTPGMTAARATGRLFGAVVALAAGFAVRPAIVTVALTGSLLASAIIARAVATAERATLLPALFSAPGWLRPAPRDPARRNGHRGH